MMTREEAVQFLVKKERESKNRAIWSSFISIIVGAIALTISMFTTNLFTNDELPTNNSIEEKINEIKTIGNSLDQLKEFMGQQKQIIITQEETINKLKKQNIELEPIVNSNQKTVDAIMAESERKVQKSIWKERSIGIFLGIIASLISSLIWSKISKK